MEALLEEVQALSDQALDPGSFLAISERLQEELQQHLALKQSQCMLPSFNYSLPTGQEQGEYLALEVGGSNLRMALVELNGRRMFGPSARGKPTHIERCRTFVIDNAVRQLQNYEFFDWMAAKIGEFLPGPFYANRALRMGVAWSFPLESVHANFSAPKVLMLCRQTSIRSGNVLGMGKGFWCSDVVKGHDLGDIITQACQRAVR